MTRLYLIESSKNIFCYTYILCGQYVVVASDTLGLRSSYSVAATISRTAPGTYSDLVTEPAARQASPVGVELSVWARPDICKRGRGYWYMKSRHHGTELMWRADSLFAIWYMQLREYETVMGRTVENSRAWYGLRTEMTFSFSLSIPIT